MRLNVAPTRPGGKQTDGFSPPDVRKRPTSTSWPWVNLIPGNCSAVSGTATLGSQAPSGVQRRVSSSKAWRPCLAPVCR
jgi:hypothetical protein